MHYIVFDNPKVIFGWTPKCGCSHLKNIAYFLISGIILNEDDPVHRVMLTYNKGLPKDLDTYKIILIIRNPL